MKSFAGKIAVVTGGGAGMGRELVKQLMAEGCHVATCDVSSANLNTRPITSTCSTTRREPLFRCWLPQRREQS